MMSNDKILHLYFWFCWAGTVLSTPLFLIGCIIRDKLPVPESLAMMLVVICIMCAIGLPLASALCIEKFPSKAKLGMISVGLTYLLISLLIGTHFV